MRRQRSSVPYRALAIVVLLALVPLLAHAAPTRAPWEGVYSGGATGTSLGVAKGGHALVFVSRDGDQVKLLVQVAGYAVEARGTPQTTSGGMISVPVTLEGADISGTGEAVLEQVGGVWSLSVTAEGIAYGLPGEGALVAKRQKTRTVGLAEQAVGTVKASLGSTDTAHVPEPVTGPVSPVTPAEPSEPVPTSDSAIAYGLMVLVLFLSIMLA
jgi:hypothetical protein